jgi:hypothetical protein
MRKDLSSLEGGHAALRDRGKEIPCTCATTLYSPEQTSDWAQHGRRQRSRHVAWRGSKHALIFAAQVGPRGARAVTLPARRPHAKPARCGRQRATAPGAPLLLRGASAQWAQPAALETGPGARDAPSAGAGCRKARQQAHGERRAAHRAACRPQSRSQHRHERSVEHSCVARYECHSCLCTFVAGVRGRSSWQEFVAGVRGRSS